MYVYSDDRELKYLNTYYTNIIYPKGEKEKNQQNTPTSILENNPSKE